jgi:thioredoxin-related protein
MEENTPQSEAASENKPNQPQPNKKPKNKNLSFSWILLIAFGLMILNIIRPHKTYSMDWLDYESGIQTAAKQHKPIMIAFYKKDNKFSEEMWADTYANKDMIDYIENTFVPILVDVDKNPEIAKEYEVSYYPFHVFKTSDNKEILKTRRGYDTPGQFKPILLEVLDKLEGEE